MAIFIRWHVLVELWVEDARGFVALPIDKMKWTYKKKQSILNNIMLLVLCSINDNDKIYEIDIPTFWIFDSHLLIEYHFV